MILFSDDLFSVYVFLQQKEKGSTSFNRIYAPVVVIKFSPVNKNNMGARIEYYNDEKQIIVHSATPNGFTIFGCGINDDR